jgi:lipopolysaccharide transport system ATP-binding protein
MSYIAIQVECLSKQYKIGKPQARYKTLRESLTNALGGALRQFSPKATSRSHPQETFWALKDVSFSVKPGEIVGLIGRNGAGKSTLLKLLSRITEPTRGRAEILGRVGSLLEVGTGFHPELTGRENVYMSGALLGMRKAEIERKFDEIVAFSEVEQFIDTSVKHYSSGMHVRLAFAVAAHLEPEILLVDEVLAVGDARFQRKCLNKMQDVGQTGRTILFVSHNMSAITRLCERVILLDDGQVINDGPAHQVVSAYLNSDLGTSAERTWADLSNAPGNDIVRLRGVRICDEDGQVTDAVDIRRPVGVQMEYQVLSAGAVLAPNFHFYNEEGVYAFVVIDTDPSWRGKPRPVGHYVSTARIPGNLLAEGSLIVGAAISTMNPVIVHVHERDAVAFQVIDSLDGNSARGDFAGPMPGVARPLLAWTTEFEPDNQTVNLPIKDSSQ